MTWEKVGYQLRDLLGDKYESSSKSKVAKKHRKKMQKQRRGPSSSRQEEPPVVSPYPTIATVNAAPMDESLMAPIPVSYPKRSSTSGHRSRLSFDALQLLTEPLIGRGSFVLEEPLQISMV